MDQQLSIAFIASRNLGQFPQPWVALYREAARAAVRWGYRVVSGAATGGDQAALEEAIGACGNIRLVLPWANYERDWCDAIRRSHPDQVETVVFNALEHPQWRESVGKYHPAAARLTRGEILLHSRNYGIIEGAIRVVALPGIRDQGGTGQGMRIAQGLGIKLVDLTQESDRASLEARLRR